MLLKTLLYDYMTKYFHSSIIRVNNFLDCIFFLRKKKNSQTEFNELVLFSNVSLILVFNECFKKIYVF